MITRHAGLRGEAKQQVALALLANGAIKFGAFRLKLHDTHPSAPPSPFYIDLRIVRSFPALLDRVTDVYADLIKDLQFDAIADVPSAATPFAAIVCHKTRTPMISPRFDSKPHGIASRIDGAFRKGQAVVVLDDLVTAADSKLRAIAVLQGEGLVVRDVAVLIDREQGGVQHLRSAGFSCHAAFRFSDLLRLYRDRQLITAEQFADVVAYVTSQQT